MLNQKKAVVQQFQTGINKEFDIKLVQYAMKDYKERGYSEPVWYAELRYLRGGQVKRFAVSDFLAYGRGIKVRKFLESLFREDVNGAYASLSRRVKYLASIGKIDLLAVEEVGRNNMHEDSDERYRELVASLLKDKTLILQFSEKDELDINKHKGVYRTADTFLNPTRADGKGDMIWVYGKYAVKVFCTGDRAIIGYYLNDWLERGLILPSEYGLSFSLNIRSHSHSGYNIVLREDLL